MKNYFKKVEEVCPCCGSGGLLPDFREKLNKAREIAGVPFVLNSAFRCSAHNSEVGGSASSSHLIGCAVDIKVENSADRYKIITALLQAGFTRIGVGKTFVHVDDDFQKPKNLIWTY